jgi:hypothetical protein
LRASLASGKPLDPEIANDKQLRQDYDYDVAKDVAKDEGELDIDDEYSELSGVVGTQLLTGVRSRSVQDVIPGSFAVQLLTGLLKTPGYW